MNHQFSCKTFWTTCWAEKQPNFPGLFLSDRTGGEADNELPSPLGMAYFGGIVSGTVDFSSWGQDLFDLYFKVFFLFLKDVCFLNTISDGLKRFKQRHAE